MAIKNIESKIIFVTCLLFVLFFDNYVNPPGVRIFDFMGVAIMITAITLGLIKLRPIHKPNLLFYFFASLTAIYMIPAGIVVHNSLSFIPFTMGLVIFWILINTNAFYLKFESIVKYSLILTSAAIFAQYLWYLLTGSMPSFAAIASETATRSSFADLVMRPTGFYIEPGSHALASVTLLMIYLTINKYRLDLVSVGAVVGTLLSMSLAGVLALFLGLALLIANKSILKAFLLAVLTFSAMYGFVVMAPKPVTDAINIVYLDRYDTLREGLDGSANDRLGKLNQDCILNIYTRYPHALIVGGGMTSDEFTPYCGSNNLSWAIFNYGLIIPLLFIVPLLWRFRKVPLILLSIFYVGASGQLSSYMFIWLYFAMLVGPLARYLDTPLPILVPKYRTASEDRR